MQNSKALLTAAVFACVATFGACVSTGVDTVEDFRSSIRGGADCKELFDQRSNFKSRSELERIDAELEKIGCTDSDSERNDQ